MQWVYEIVSEALDGAFVATDDERIADAVKKIGGNAILTSSSHSSGTERICEALDTLGIDVDIVVNVQGDEPFIQASQIRSLCNCFDDCSTEIATLAKPFDNHDNINDLLDCNNVKVVIDNNFNALYFSRSPIPFLRDVPQEKWLQYETFYKHIGVYAFRPNVLRQITKLPQSSLEVFEKLEQLRWLQNGYKIKVKITDNILMGIDTPSDLLKAEEYLHSHNLC